MYILYYLSDAERVCIPKQTDFMLRKIFLLILIFITFTTSAKASITYNPTIKASSPAYVVSGGRFDIRLDGPIGQDSLVFNNIKHPVKEDADGKYIRTRIQNAQEFHFQDPNVRFDSVPPVIPGWMSILPPLLAIGLALIIKEVLISLFLGIYIGSAIIGVYTKGVIGLFTGFFTVLDKYLVEALTDADHVSVILFSVLIGSVVAVISRNGGMQGVVNRIVRFARNRKSGMMTTYLLGIAIFFDDYANTLVVGNTMRPVTDKLRISREKLAYLVDSTAAPVAAIAFVTTWIGAELGYISSGIENINENLPGRIHEGAYSFFVNSLAYSFYPLFTLFFMFFLVRMNRDYGPMRKFEAQAIREGVDGGADNDESTVDLKEFEPVNPSRTKAFNAIIPIFVVVFGTITGLIVTGLHNWGIKLQDAGISTTNGVWSNMHLYPAEPPVSFIQKVGALIGEANSYTALLWSSLSGLFVALVLTVAQRVMKIQQSMETVLAGVKTMIPAVLILVFAWSLAAITKDLHTADFIQSLFGDHFEHVWIVPAITFVLSGAIAFSTGSSWSTMAILYPIMIPTAYTVCLAAGVDPMPIMYNTVASVLAGSVLGDHCSPISDTTILSSLASSCNHINHVRTQMPYALSVGAVALFIGIIPGALGVSSLITLPIGVLICFALVRFVGKPNAS